MFEAPKLDEVSKGLLEAADLIEKHGWWDGGSQPGDRFCAALAMNKVFMHHDDKRSAAYIRLAKQACIPRTGYIPTWNDSSNAETVIKTMREAAYNQGPSE